MMEPNLNMAKYDRENGCIGHFKIDDIAKDE